MAHLRPGTPLATWILAAAGESVTVAVLAMRLRATAITTLRAVATVLDGQSPPPLEQRTETEAWLAALLAQATGGEPLAHLRGLTAPEPRLWLAWCSGPTLSAALGVLRHAAPPWRRCMARRPTGRCARRRGPPSSPCSHGSTRPQQLAAEVRRIATLAAAGEEQALTLLDHWAPALDRDLADALWLAVAGRLATPAALAAAPDDGPGAERVNWLRALQAWSSGEPAGPYLERLPPAVLASPAVAWTIAERDPARAYSALSRALQAHRERLDLVRGLAHHAALNGDVTRAVAWATGLRGTPAEAAADVAVALLTEPWDEPRRWPTRWPAWRRHSASRCCWPSAARDCGRRRRGRRVARATAESPDLVNSAPPRSGSPAIPRRAGDPRAP